MTSRTLRLRHTLLVGVALAFAAPAFAQAVQASAAPVGGSAGAPSTTAIVGGQRDTVRVNTPTAVINWRPNDVAAGATPIDFLPANNELRFISALPTYTVLNRIIPAGLAAGRTVAINGGVDSFVNVSAGPPPGLPTQRGGNIWFYSPNGLLVGATGRFNVGSLALTTLDHAFDGQSGALTFGGGGEFLFGGLGADAVVPTSSVIVSPGAVLSANNAPNSYVALIGPRVEQRGSIVVNGTAALAAGEQVTVDLAGGLLSLTFFQGTTVANAITHTGSTTGPAQTGGGSIVLAAVPKNTVVTTLVSGTLGYTPAATATVQNGAVVLSAGYNVSGGVANVFFGSPPNGDIVIGNANFTSSVFGDATGTLTASPTAPGALSFSSNATFSAGQLVSVGADSGETVTVGGDLTVSSTSADNSGIARIFSTATPGSPLSTPSVTVAGATSVGADRRGRSGEDGESTTGATAQIVVTGGNMTFGQNLLISSQGSGGDSSSGPFGGSGTGGDASLTINGGTVTVNGILSVLADGLGGSSFNFSGDGTGGTASVTLNAGATPSVLNLNAFGNVISATGGIAGQFPSDSGGDVRGGVASLTINSGTVNATDLAVQAFAIGGAANGGAAGTAFGGTSQLRINAGRLNVRTLTLNSDEFQGAASTGGTAGSTQGTGVAAVDVTGTGVLSVGATGGGSMSISANAVKAAARAGVAATGGNLIGGTARLTATNGGSITTDATAPSAPKPPVLLTASVIFDEAVAGGPSGIQRAGNVNVTADGGTMSLHGLDLRANALVRAFANGTDIAGRSFGGTVSLTAANGGTLAVRAGSGATPISAFATGGNIAAPANGTGGTINVRAQGGTLTLSDGLTADARGFGGSGATLGGNGGTINVQSAAGTGAQPGSLTAGVTVLDASGQLNAASPNGPAGAINVSNTGAGQTMRFGDLTAFAGQQFSTGTAGTINVTGDNAAIDITNSASFQTLGDLAITMSGLAGRLNVGANLRAGGNNIILSHLGVAPATNLTTIAANNVDMQAGNVIQQGTDFRFVGPATIRGNTVRLTARRVLGGADGAIFATGGIEFGNGRNITFRTVDANGGLSGYNDVSSTTPFVNVTGAFNIGNSLRVGLGNIDIRAGTGIDIADGGTGATGQILLSSTTGDVRLATSGVALATRPNGITMTASAGTARFTDLFSRGSITIAGSAGVFGGNASAAFGMSATSGTGGVTVGNLQGTSTTVTAATSIVAGTIFGATGTTLTATTGSITATAASAPGGSVTANGSTGVDIATVTASGATTLSAPNGPVRVATDLRPSGNLVVNGQSLFLRSIGSLTTGTLTASGAGGIDVATGGSLTLTAAQAANGPVTLSGAIGLTVPTVISGGTTSLTSTNGDISIAAALRSAGVVTAVGRSVVILGSGPLAFGTASATTGLGITTDGALAVTTASAATGPLTLFSTNGTLTFGTVQTPGVAVLRSAQTITGTSVNAGDFVNLIATSGIDVATVIAGGNTTITAPNGAVRIATNLAVGGTLNVDGRSLFIRSTGSLTTGTLLATGPAGIDVATGGALTLTAARALAGPLTLAGTTGLTVPTIVSGGATSLASVNGAVSVATNLQSAGPVTASGRSVLLRATAGLSTTALTATAGNVDVSVGGSLTAASIQASVDAILNSGTVLTPGAVTAGRDIVLTAQSLQASTLTAPRDLRIVTTGMAQATGTISATRALTVNAGQTNFQAVNGGSVAITSGQGVIFSTMTSGGAATLNAGDDAIGTSIAATGNVTVTAGRNINFGPVTAANLTANATGNLTTGQVTASEDIRLSTGAAPASMTTGNLTAGDDIILSGNAVTTGNLTTTGLGPDVEGTGSTIDLQLNRITTGIVDSAGSILLAASQPIGFASTNSRTATIIRSFGTIIGGGSVAGTTLDIQGGNIDVGNGQAGGTLNYVNFNPGETIRTGTLTGASVTASSRGTLATGAVNAPGAVNLFGDLGLTVASATSTGGDLQLSAQTSGPISSGALRAGGNLTVSGQAGNDVLTTLDAGGRILIGAGAGTLTFTRATAGGLVGVSAGGNIGFGTVQAGGTFQMQTPGTITGTSATSTGGAPNVVQGDAGITLPTLVTNGVTVLTATNGPVSVATDLRSTGAVTARGRSVFLRSGGALAFDEITATAGGADVATTGALTVAQATASGALALTSGGTATFNGVATGATVAVASPDIVIAANGRLGTLGTTTQLTLTNSSTQNRTFIGGTGGAGYSLSAAEMGRLTANNITIVAPVIGTASTAFNSSRLPDVSIDAFTFAANTGLGANGSFAIQTGGKVRVTGAVSFTGMGNGQTFAIRGDEAIEVLDAGRIALNGTGALGGTLDLTSRNIVASSSAALADFAAAADLKAISDRAGKNDGAPDDGGYLQANAIRATLLNSTLIIQNTGAATTTANRDYSGRRGFTVGAGGFTVVQGGTNPVRIAVNGRQVGATTPLGAPTVGGFVTGLDIIPLIKIVSLDTQAGTVFQVPASGVLTAEQLAAAPRLFDTTSTVNGCTITGGSGCRVVPNDPIRDILLGDFGEGSVGNLLPLALIQLKDYVTPGDEPLIDEPVTGAGNDDLWSVDDTKPKCDPAKEVCK